MACWLSENANKKVRMVAVGADWSNNKPQLVYENAIKSGDYYAPASGILHLLQHAVGNKDKLFEPLAEVGAEFGYRSAKEIARFVAIHRELSGDGWQYQDALDAQVLQKLMPKLHGSERKLSGVLRSLEKFAKEKGLPLTKNKVERMLQRLKDEGFTSFAEN